MPALRKLDREPGLRLVEVPVPQPWAHSSTGPARHRRDGSNRTGVAEHFGVFVTGFGFPVVPEGPARVRVQMSAALDEHQLDRALETFGRFGADLGVVR